MEQLWTPWRMKYIKEEKPDYCVFCKVIKEKKDKQNFVLIRNKRAISVLNIYPYNNGHIMIIPARHISDFNQITMTENKEMFLQSKAITQALKETIDPQGFNIGLNMGSVAGAGIEEHLHIHIVPRWEGDTNFMPLLGKTKVIPETLSNTYKKLKNNLHQSSKANKKGKKTRNKK